MKTWYIAKKDNENVVWDNDLGWVDLHEKFYEVNQCTLFNDNVKEQVNLPIGGKWVLFKTEIEKDKDYYLEESRGGVTWK